MATRRSGNEMSTGSPITTRNVLAFASIVEVGTGLALLAVPHVVVGLLLGTRVPVEEIALGRLPGIAILALGLACWPGGQGDASRLQPVRGMLVYNMLMAVFLVWLFTVDHMGGALLWPGVVLHGAVALLLVWTRRVEPGASVPRKASM